MLNWFLSGSTPIVLTHRLYLQKYTESTCNLHPSLFAVPTTAKLPGFFWSNENRTNGQFAHGYEWW